MKPGPVKRFDRRISTRLWLPVKESLDNESSRLLISSSALGRITVDRYFRDVSVPEEKPNFVRPDVVLIRSFLGSDYFASGLRIDDTALFVFGIDNTARDNLIEASSTLGYSYSHLARLIITEGAAKQWDLN